MKNKKQNSLKAELLNYEILPNKLKFNLYLNRIPSVNIRFILHRYLRRFILNYEYRKIKNLLTNIFDKFRLPGEEFQININVKKIVKNKITKIDADNILKIILDSISCIIGGDDFPISNINIKREYIKMNELTDKNLIKLIDKNKRKRVYGYLLNIELVKIKWD